ncbi:MAG: glycerophosphodiester phosphodiesterase family protein [Candidatus Marinimicrobia bacterium]|nr:glycerophosphodiester phosphodiesterase family protein [Candidatus Neomarinimicrobiota bacterium]MDD5709877.1 glycerophosphodiester phosphodiesterase family protein [Candidatus Neomarinimicrobiota bacterium]
MRKFSIIAHRGASGYAPENTLAAFARAVELKVDAVECDVQICRSGEALVFHDRRLKRITGKRGKFRRKKLAELRKLDAGNGETIPTLKEVLDLLDARCAINIELKSRKTAVPVAQIIRNSIRTGSWKTEDFFVSSFYFRELRHFHEIMPEVPLALLFAKKPRGLKRKIRLLRPFAANLSAEHIRPEWVKRVHHWGLKVYVWTVDDPKEAARLRAMGADGFFSNYPDRLGK